MSNDIWTYCQRKEIVNKNEWTVCVEWRLGIFTVILLAFALHFYRQYSIENHIITISTNIKGKWPLWFIKLLWLIEAIPCVGISNVWVLPFGQFKWMIAVLSTLKSQAFFSKSSVYKVDFVTSSYLIWELACLI